MTDEMTALANLIRDQRTEAIERHDVLMRMLTDLSPRIDRIDQRLDGIGWRMGALDTQAQRLGDRVDGLAARIDQINRRVETLEHDRRGP